MAVVQISRIQIRRGRKNSGSGIPQLAGGELGWAVDSQELYIGNGSVSEGSPAVGNTKVLTENDNLFTLADQYTYQDGTIQTGATVSGPIKRTLQSRLDDIVSIKSFGGIGDGSDQTSTLQRAIDQLFINTASKGTTQSRVTLVLEAGTYNISNSIKIPPHATIKGAGRNKTFIVQTGNYPIFTTVNSNSTPGNYADDSTSTSLTQAQDITLEGMTLQHNLGSFTGIELVSCKNSVFKNLQIKGPWTSGIGIVAASIGVSMDNLSTVVGCFNNLFDDVKIDGFAHGVKSDDDVYENTFTNCLFDLLSYGVWFGENTIVGAQGQSTGPQRNLFESSTFSNIDRNAIIFQTGRYNVSSNNKFVNVGNNGGTSTAAAYTIINSVQEGNKTCGDWFSRTNDLMLDTAFQTTPYISEVQGPIHSGYSFSNKIQTIQQNSFETIFRLPGDYTRTYIIEYQYKSNQVDAMRQGILEVIVNKSNDSVTYSDTYDYNGDAGIADKLELKAQLFDINSDTVNDTLAIRMKNTVVSENADFTYKVSIKN